MQRKLMFRCQVYSHLLLKTFFMKRKQFTTLKIGFISLFMLIASISCKKQVQPFTPPPLTEILKNFVPVGGNFDMGSPVGEPGRNNDETSHNVMLKKFSIAKNLVTVEEFMQFVKITSYKYDAIAYPPSSNPNDPMVFVSWFDAAHFSNWLSTIYNLERVYTFYPGLKDKGDNDSVSININANGFRLPTEAEWEYACRAGNPKAYCFGDYNVDSLDAYAWYKPNASNQYHQVGTKKANQFGLYDMHGNIIEWCSDWYGEYTVGNVSNPTGALTGTSRVTRGGYFSDDSSILRSAYRYAHGPTFIFNGLGFRLAKSM